MENKSGKEIMDLPTEVLHQILRHLWKFHLNQVVFVNGRLGEIATKILQDRLDQEKIDQADVNAGWPDPYEDVYPAALKDAAHMKSMKVCSILTIFIY